MIIPINRTPNQPLNLQRTSRFIPESRRNGDRYARTLEEAFGPGAELEVERGPLPGPTLKGFAISVAVALFMGLVSWMANHVG